MTAPPAGALEACPFCGREAHLTFDKSFGGFVSCSTEGCAGNAHAAQHDRSQIIAAWNRRTHGPALLAALRLREGCEAWMRRIEREADAHTYFADNADLRMTAGDHAMRAKKLKAIRDDLARVLEEGR